VKQRITVEQLNELTGEQKLRLAEWSLKKGYSKEVLPSFEDSPETRRLEVPCLTIGQCIELLSAESWLGITSGTLKPGGPTLWDVDCCEGEQENSLELIDALWEAVKAVLDGEGKD
jgi:hypothetical protein